MMGCQKNPRLAEARRGFIFSFFRSGFFMKFLLLLFFILNVCWIHAQERPPPPHLLLTASINTPNSVGIFQKVEVEASSPGGFPAWKKFLEDILSKPPFVNSSFARTVLFAI
jgi:hypothetical protein